MGPCLCGDPYCSSCGNPEAALWEDLITTISNKVAVQNPIGSDDTVVCVLEFLSEDQIMADALVAYAKRKKV